MFASKRSRSLRPVRVVYIENDERLAWVTTQFLAAHRVEVRHVGNHDDAVREVLTNPPDVVLLEWAKPAFDAAAFCRDIRARLTLAIVVITRKSTEADRIYALEEMGADDFVAKPAGLNELLARVRAHARRLRGESGPRRSQLNLGRLTIDTGRMEVSVDGVAIPLPTYDFAVLVALARRPGSPQTREVLQYDIRGSSRAFDRSIDAAVSRLRGKLESNPRRPQWIKTIRGVGYLLVGDEGNDSVPGRRV